MGSTTLAAMIAAGIRAIASHADRGDSAATAGARERSQASHGDALRPASQPPAARNAQPSGSSASA